MFDFEFEKLNGFRERNLFTDVSFVVEGEEVRAHKIVLSARSEVFELMFTTPMSEAINVVHITDVSRETFEIFVRFLYTNRLQGVEKHYDALLYLADKYLVKRLTQSCVELLTNDVGSRSTVELLSLAESFKIPELKEKLFAHLSDVGDEFIRSENFKQLQIADFRFSEMVVSGIKPTTVSKTVNITPDFWCSGVGEEFIEVRNNGNIVRVKVELKHRRKTLYGYLELMSECVNCPVEMTFKFTILGTDGSLMHSGHGDVWWESQLNDEDSECRSQPESRLALFEYCHQSETAIKNMHFVFCITLSQWVKPARIFQKRKGSDHVRVTPTKVYKCLNGKECSRVVQYEKNAQGPVVLDDKKTDGIEATTLETLRLYISSGLLPEESEVNSSLILGAHKISLSELVGYCEKVISSKVDVENAVKILILARQLALKELKDAALDFIDLHHLEVVASKGWPRLKNHPELVAAILKKLLSKPPL